MTSMIMTAAAMGLLALGGAALLPGAAQAQSAPAPGPSATTAPAEPGGLFGAAPRPKRAGTFEVSLGAIGVIPETSSSHITPIGGGVNASGGVSPELTLSYFVTDHWSLQLIAASTHHRISAGDSALGHVDVGSAWVLPPTLTLDYNFMPDRRFSPYVGLGLTVAFFYATSPSEPVIQKFNLTTAVGPAIDLGFDYALSGPWYANFDVKQMFLETSANITSAVGPVKATTWLNPTVVGASIGYRF